MRTLPRTWFILILWLLLAAALLPRASGLEKRLEVGARIAGSGSAAVEADLATRFGSPFAQFVVLVVTDAPAPESPEGRAFLGSLTKRLTTVPGVAAVRGYQGPADIALLGSDGRTTLVLVGLDGESISPDITLAELRAATAAFPGATLRWTGQAALNADLRRMSADDAARAERRVLPLTLLLLLFAFGSITAAALPVLAGALTIGLAYGAAALIAAHWPLSIALQNVVSMIGLGLGIDYALLSVSRFREARADGLDPVSAAEETVRGAAHTLMISGLAVAVGFAGLLFIPVSELRSVAVGGLLTVLIAVLIAVTLLPIVLARFGKRIDRWRFLERRSRAGGGDRWRRWGTWVTRHPVKVLLVAGLPVALLAAQAQRLVVGEPTGDWMPPRMESAIALADLRRVERAAALQTIRVILDLPARNEVQTAAGVAAATKLHLRLASDARVAFVRPTPAPDGSAMLFDVVPRESATVDTLTALVGELRQLDLPAVTGLPGARIGVGGLPAFRADYLDAVGDALPVVVLVIVVGTLVALAVGFRSVLVPLKAVAAQSPLRRRRIRRGGPGVPGWPWPLASSGSPRRSTKCSSALPPSSSAPCSDSAWTTRSSSSRASVRRAEADSAKPKRSPTPSRAPGR